jgi:gamma-glutamylcyclotransferase (GGCT)/AIG2-like uncharacterized protein YtfP
VRWVFLSLVAVLVLALVIIVRAPVFLPPLSMAAPLLPVGNQRVFGYATLANPVVRSVVAGQVLPGEPAVLYGWERVGRHLRPDPEAHVGGVVFTVTPEAMMRLDRYERAGVRYLRERKILGDGTEAWVYRMIYWEGGR